MKLNLIATGLLLMTGALAAQAVTTVPEPIMNPEGTAINYLESGTGWFFFAGILPLNQDFQDMPVSIVYGDDDKVYIQNIVPRFHTDSYVEAVKDGDKIILTLPQLVKVEKRDGSIYEYYVDRMDLELVDKDPDAGGNVDQAKEATYWPSKERDVVYRILDDGSIEMEDSDGSWAIGITNDDGLWQGNADWNCRYVPNGYTLLTPPEGLHTETMEFIANYTGNNVEVGFDGDDIYVKGACVYCPDAWIKGTMKDGQAVFENGQYLGVVWTHDIMGFFYGGWCYPDPKYIWGYSLADNFTMDYDAETKTLTSKQTIIINDNANDVLHYMHCFRYPEIHPVSNEHSEVPMDIAPITYVPYGYSGACIGFQFYLPNLSTDKYILPKDELYWSLYVDDELYTFEPYQYEDLKKDMWEIPFNCDVEEIENPGESVIHTVYIYIEEFESLGMVSFRKMPGVAEPLYSEMAYIYSEGNSVKGLPEGEVPEGEERIFDLNGMPVKAPAKGRVYIVNKGDKTVKRIF